jgi:hypothetical protein
MIEFVQADCLEWMKDQPADRFDLVFGSPPYCDARTYGIGAQRNVFDWVEWMLKITTEAARICKGPVIWVAAGVTRKRNYWPACEGLMWEWFRLGGDKQLYRPCVFHRVGIPGSGGKDWFRADWEYVMCFKRPGELAWADNTACGHPPKWAPGGSMSHRLADGSKRNQWGHSMDSCTCSARKQNGKRDKKYRPSHKLQTRRKANGERALDGEYAPPVLANPGNVFKLKVGGGLMGNKLAHENEAPFPEQLVEIFIKSCCPSNGTVLDPFFGSGTTGAVAERFGRNTVGVDI